MISWRTRLKRTLASPIISHLSVPVVRRLGDHCPQVVTDHLPVSGKFHVKCGPSRFRILTSPGDVVGREAVIHGIDGYEAATMTTFLNLARTSKGVILDVGANVGIYGLAAASVNSNVDIYQFEPVPETFARLASNVALNRHDHLHPRQLALGDRPGVVEMFVPPGRFPLEASLLSDFRAGAQSLLVPSVRLDDFLKEVAIETVGLIKIDTEGAEDRVIRGCLEMLARDRPPIICEILPSRPPARVLPSLLRPLGYAFFYLHGDDAIEFDGSLEGYTPVGDSYNFLIRQRMTS